APAEHWPTAEAVGEGPAAERSDRPGDEETAEDHRPIGGAVPLRLLPERDEGEQAHVRDAAEPHDDEEKQEAAAFLSLGRARRRVFGAAWRELGEVAADGDQRR